MNSHNQAWPDNSLSKCSLAGYLVTVKNHQELTRYLFVHLFSWAHGGYFVEAHFMRGSHQNPKICFFFMIHRLSSKLLAVFQVKLTTYLSIHPSVFPPIYILSFLSICQFFKVITLTLSYYVTALQESKHSRASMWCEWNCSTTLIPHAYALELQWELGIMFIFPKPQGATSISWFYFQCSKHLQSLQMEVHVKYCSIVLP